MLNIKISAGSKRNEVNVDETSTVLSVLQERNISVTSGTQVSLDGVMLSATEMHSTLADLKATDGSFLAVVVKADSAR